MRSDLARGAHAPDGIRSVRRQPQMLDLSLPHPARAVNEVLAFKGLIVRKIPFPQRYLEIGFLGMVRVQTHRNEDTVAMAGRGFPVIEHVVVEGIVERQSEM